MSRLFRFSQIRLLKVIQPRWNVQSCELSSAREQTEPCDDEFPEPIAKKEAPRYDIKYPDFIPNPMLEVRNYLREKLERMDMLKRRRVINLPQFTVGSIVAVTSSSKDSPNATVRFLGICIQRSGYGLESKFILRNVINGEGVEVKYVLYSPTIQKIQVIRLERRLDEELFYLRDAPLEYSTFPQDMEMSYVTSDEIPINTLKVPLNPRPWLQRYERMNLKGVILPPISEKLKEKAKKQEKPWVRFDLMEKYRKSIPEEEQKEIFEDIQDELNQLEEKIKFTKKKKNFAKPKKQSLF